MNAVHLHNLNSFALPKFGKYKKLTKLFEVIFLLVRSYGCITPLTWYEQENLGHKAHFEAFPGTP